MSKRETEWTNEDAEAEFKRIRKKLFGKPTGMVAKKHGIAYWKGDAFRNDIMINGKKNCLYEHVIKDQKIPHYCPSKHYDFEYSYVKVKVDPWQIAMIKSISGSVLHDALDNLLGARCASIEANYVTLKLATDLLLGNEVKHPDLGIEYSNLKEVQKSGAYGKMIKS